jgi:hypothetical protein
MASTLFKFIADFNDFLLEFGEYAFNGRPIKTDCSGLFLQFMRPLPFRKAPGDSS